MGLSVLVMFSHSGMCTEVVFFNGKKPETLLQFCIEELVRQGHCVATENTWSVVLYFAALRSLVVLIKPCRRCAELEDHGLSWRSLRR